MDSIWKKTISFLLFCDDVSLYEISFGLVLVKATVFEDFSLSFQKCPLFKQTLLSPLISRAPHHGRNNSQPTLYPMSALEMGTQGRRQWKKTLKAFQRCCCVMENKPGPCMGPCSRPHQSLHLHSFIDEQGISDSASCLVRHFQRAS